MAPPRRGDDRGSASQSRFALYGYHGVPEWQRDNEYIQKGYRAHYTLREAALSMFRCHNETLNVWTHLLGSVAIVALLVFTVTTVSPYGADRIAALKRALLPEIGVTPESQFEAPNANLFLDANAVCVLPIWRRHPLQQPQCANPFHPSVAPHPVRVELAHVEGALHAHVSGLEALARKLRETTVSSLHTVAEASRGALEQSLASLEGNAQRLRHALSHVCVHCEDSLHVLGNVRNGLWASFGAVSNSLADARHSLADRAQHAAEQLVEKLEAVGAGIDALHLLSPNGLGRGVHPYLTQWPLVLFFACAFACLFMSALFHLFFVVSERLARRLRQLDYAGISLLILGSDVPILYYGFYCSRGWAWFYIVLSTVICSAGLIVSLLDRFSTPHYRPLRAGMFVAMGVSGGLPASHILAHIGVHEVFLYLLAMGGLYIIGALFYSLRVPERCSPGTFDLCCSSHNVFHTLVFAAVVTYWFGIVQFYEWRMLHTCAGPASH
jgi:channel protein (hemolysin III family)